MLINLTLDGGENMTEAEFKDVMKEIIIAAGAAAVAFYSFVILAFIFDIH